MTSLLLWWDIHSSSEYFGLAQVVFLKISGGDINCTPTTEIHQLKGSCSTLSTSGGARSSKGVRCICFWIWFSQFHGNSSTHRWKLVLTNYHAVISISFRTGTDEQRIIFHVGYLVSKTYVLIHNGVETDIVDMFRHLIYSVIAISCCFGSSYRNKVSIILYLKLRVWQNRYPNSIEC